MKQRKYSAMYAPNLIGRHQTGTVEETLERMDTSVPIRSSQIIQSFAEKPGKVFLLYGDKSVFALSLHMAAQAMAHGTSLAVVDGCNRFDVHSLSRFAREHRLDPNAFLNRIHISRGFTCYQMEQAVANKLPSFLKKIGSNTAMVFGLLETFYDEQASLREVQNILQRLMRRLQEMKEAGLSLLIVCQERTIAPAERNQLFTAFKRGVDRTYKLDVNENGKLQLFLDTEQLSPHAIQQAEGVYAYGTNSTNIHQPDRRGAGKLVKIPARTACRGSGSV